MKIPSDIPEYVKQLEREKESVSTLGIEVGDSGATVLSTWKVTLERIKSERHGDLAIQILNVACFMNPDHIPKKMMMFLARDKIALGKSILLLHQYSMVRTSPTSFSIHRYA